VTLPPGRTAGGPPTLLVVGSVNLDLVLEVDAAPAAGQTVLASASRSGLGGKGANQAVVAASLGCRTRLLAAVGRDDAGTRVRAALAEAGVDTASVATVEHPTGQAVILLEANAENRIVVAPGANYHLELSGAEAALSGADAVLSQLEVPPEVVRVVFGAARRRRTRTVLNAAPVRPDLADLLAYTDVLVVNEGEARALSGEPDPHEALDQLRRRGPGMVVVTRGAGGAIGADGTGRYEQPAFPVDVVDTTGAGDAFVGALTTELIAGRALPRALRRACAAGSLAATIRGAAVRLDCHALDHLVATSPGGGAAALGG